MTDIVERLRALVIMDEVRSDNPLGREAADEIERLEAKCSQVDRYIALLNGEIADNGKLRDEIEKLRAFVRWALTEGSWRGADLDGGAIQDKAIELNLVTKVKYDPAIHGEDDFAEEGDDWYVPR